jgi:two-component system chemotaxis response regulator CheB
MANRDVLAIGTSAGGVEALLFLAGRFPRNFPASILITIHLPSYCRSSLDLVLSNSGPLLATFARDGESLERSRIYIAPPERHLIVDGNRLWLGNGPRENRARPAIDPMLRSTAVCCCARTIGVILTGVLGDGAAGLSALSQCSGITVVQDPADAMFQEMPATALGRVKPDHVVPLSEMPALLEKLVKEPAGQARPASWNVKYEVEIAKGERAMTMEDMDRIGRRSVLTCPDCGGTMWEVEDANLVRYRCHVGHAYTSELMSIAFDETLRRTLATALRTLDERVALARKLSTDARQRGHSQVAGSWATEAEEFEQQANWIRVSIKRIDEMVARMEAEEKIAPAEAERMTG